MNVPELLAILLPPALQSALFLLYVLQTAKEKRELLDRLMAKDLNDLYRLPAAKRRPGKLQSRLEDWRAKKAAKEIESSEDH